MTRLMAVFVFGLAILAGGTTVPLSAQAPAPQATLEDFSWLAGRWRGTLGERNTEVIYSQPEAGVMMGMFRLTEGERTVVLEFFSLRTAAEGLEMRLRHFSPSLELGEKDDAIILRLASYDGTEAVFENPVHTRPKQTVIHRTGPDNYVVRSEIIGDSGEARWIEVAWQRVEPADSGSAPAGDDPFTGSLQFLYGIARRNILAAAEEMPEADFAFRPAAEVRSFGQLVAHVGDAMYLFCSGAKGEPNPNQSQDNIEKTKTTKAELLEALRTSFAYCDDIYNSLTDATLGEKISFFSRETSKAAPLNLNIYHLSEHYGNMVTYMRQKGLVPPSSRPRTP
jgi:uncharacterized damage-inducible protein DinB